MGNSNSYDQAGKRGQKFMKMFKNNYELTQKKQDQVFGQIQLYRNKSTKIIQIMIKKINYSQDNQLKQLIDTMSSRIIHPLPNLLGIYNLQVIKEKTFCGSYFQIKIYVQYIQKNLKNQLKKRRKHKSYFFSEQQLWKIAISLINAIKNLHDLNIFHGEIRVENVLIDGDYHMKLAEKTLLPKTNWEVELQLQNLTLIKGKGILFSPLLLQCLYHKKTQLAQYDPFKADIYAVGMILLQCSSLKRAQDFYDYEKFGIKTKDINYAMYQIRKKYSVDFVNLISKMLQQDDNDRPTAEQIHSKIKKIPNQTIRQLNMTLNESFLNQSIRSYL